MDIILKEAKKIAISLIVIDIIIVIVTLLTNLFTSSVVFGIIYGFVFAELTFILLGTIVDKALGMDARRAKRYMRINYAIRFVLMAIILIIPFTSTTINGWCVAISMLAPKLTYFSIGFYSLIPKRKEKDNIEH